MLAGLTLDLCNMVFKLPSGYEDATLGDGLPSFCVHVTGWWISPRSDLTHNKRPIYRGSVPGADHDDAAEE